MRAVPYRHKGLGLRAVAGCRYRRRSPRRGRVVLQSPPDLGLLPRLRLFTPLEICFKLTHPVFERESKGVAILSRGVTYASSERRRKKGKRKFRYPTVVVVVAVYTVFVFVAAVGVLSAMSFCRGHGSRQPSRTPCFCRYFRAVKNASIGTRQRAHSPSRRRPFLGILFNTDASSSLTFNVSRRDSTGEVSDPTFLFLFSSVASFVGDMHRGRNRRLFGYLNFRGWHILLSDKNNRN